MKVFLAVFAVSTCFAQRSAVPARAAVASPAGFGNVAHPGTPSPIPTNSSRPGFTARTGQNIGRRYQSYAYPAFAGAYYGGSYGSSYYGDGSGNGYSPAAQQPPVNVTVVNAPPQVPTVIINQNYGPLPQLPPAPAEVADAPPAPHYFLVAFKDHSVYSALTYWIEANTLHYVTPQQTHNQASLDLVDMEFTDKLNNH